jgi:oxygen-independent coproporphyrinogen-3 oxidase
VAGIYIHIPFCRRACHYCDFHFTTNLNRTEELVAAIVSEIRLRNEYLQNQSINTIYFGGGTPSLLPTALLATILEEVYKYHSVSSISELTLEANPEDLSREKLNELRSIGINRLSLGTQSFIDAELKWMNRMHTADQAKKAISEAQQAGFDNISIDLIFGLPDQTDEHWNFNLQTALRLGVQHISSYSLTVEPKTVLYSKIQKGVLQAPEENNSARFFLQTIDALTSAGFDHYEISNYAMPGFVSKHNSSYWKGVSYLGIGPSAHSYNGTSRQWNPRSNAAYMRNIGNGKTHHESEVLSVSDHINEHIMTGLRTKWGVQKKVIDRLDTQAWSTLEGTVNHLYDSGLHISEDAIYLDRNGMLMADKLTSLLFV